MPSEQEVERMVVRIIGDGSLYQRMLKDAERATAATARTIEATTSRFGGVGAKLSQLGGQVKGMGQGYLGTALSIGGVAGAGATIFDSVKLAADMELIKSNFEVMLKSKEQADALVAKLTKFAADTPLVLGDITKYSQMLLKAGVSAADIIPSLTAIGDVAMGDSEKMGRLAYAYQQVKTAGHLRGGETLQFTEAGFNPLQEMERTSGKSMPELLKMQEQGKITFQMVADAFKTATSGSGAYTGAMEKASKTTSGLFATMKDDMDGFKRTLGEMIIKDFKLHEAMKEVSKAAQDLQAWLARLSPESRELAVTIAKVIGVVALVGIGLAGLGVVLGGIATAVTVVTTAFGLLWAVIGTGVGFILSPVGLVLVALVGIGAVLVSVSEDAQGFVLWLGGGFERLGQIATESWGGIVAAFKKGDLEAAGKIALAGLNLAWVELWNKFEIAWIGFKYFFGSGWDVLTTGLAEGMVIAAYGIQIVFEKMAAAGINAFVWMARTSLDAVIAVGEAMAKLDPTPLLDRGVAAAKRLRDSIGGVDSAEAVKKLEKERDTLLRIIDDEEKARDIARKRGLLKDVEAADAKIKAARDELKALVDAAKAPAVAAAAPEAELAGATVGKAVAKGIAKELPKLDAMLFGSADALARIAEYKDKLGARTPAGPGVAGAGPVPIPEAPGPWMHPDPEQVDLLKEIRDVLKRDGDVVRMEPAGLA